MKKIITLTVTLFCYMLVTAQVNLNYGLVLCMPFNGNANDLSGKNNHGTISGATLTNDRFNNPNSAYSFDGTTNFISVAGSTSLDSIEIKDQLTVSVWCKVNDWYQSWNVFSFVNKHNAISDFGWDYNLQAPVSCSEQFFFPNSVGSPGLCTFTAAGTTTFGQWNHYAITYSKSGNAFKAYKNGILVTSMPTNSLELENTQNGILYIGYSPAGPDEYSNGVMDDLRLYCRALNANEIMALYNGVGCETISTSIKNDNSMKANFTVYPNPNNGEFIIETPTEMDVTITNALGQLILQKHLNQGKNKIELQEQAKGIYFVKAKNGNYKLIKE